MVATHRNPAGVVGGGIDDLVLSFQRRLAAERRHAAPLQVAGRARQVFQLLEHLDVDEVAAVFLRLNLHAGAGVQSVRRMRPPAAWVASFGRGGVMPQRQTAVKVAVGGYNAIGMGIGIGKRLCPIPIPIPIPFPMVWSQLPTTRTGPLAMP